MQPRIDLAQLAEPIDRLLDGGRLAQQSAGPLAARAGLLQALLEFETLTGDEIQKLLAGETIERGGVSGPAIPAAGSSIPKAKRPKPGTIGGPAAAGA